MDENSLKVDTTPGAVTRARGFVGSGAACGLKSTGDPDLALVVCEKPATAAGMFTQNAFRAAPVIHDQEILMKNRDAIRAVVVNAGNANACTGEQGKRDARVMAESVASAVGLPQGSVLVMSTGIIGHAMPMDRIRAGIQAAAASLSTNGGGDCARAIITTDLVVKEASVSLTLPGVGLVTIGGMAKGSGMIHPDLAGFMGGGCSGGSLHATMLALVVTDAPISSHALQLALETAAKLSFNRISVDGDTSTNDTVLAMASGCVPGPTVDERSPAFPAFVTAMTAVCQSLAKQVARDGEGATKLVEISVNGAADDHQAEAGAKTIATSPLVKTALYGNDPNWGRVLAALGRSGIAIDVDKVALWLGDTQLVAAGEPLEFDRGAMSAYLAASEVTVVVELGLGPGSATVWTCDFTYKYVEINAEYHT